MSFENLFIRTSKSIGGIELDAVISETHDSSVRITNNPVELGVDVADHSVVEPKRLSVIAQVSDTPLGSAALGQIVDSVTGLFGTSTSSNLTRSNSAYNAMVQIMEEREPIEIQTKLKLYRDMVITNISVTQDKDSSRVVLMNISLQEVRITQSQIVTMNASQLAPGPTRQQAASADSRGRQQAISPDAGSSRSVLKSIVDWVN